jgi:hypothetical protein
LIHRRLARELAQALWLRYRRGLRLRLDRAQPVVVADIAHNITSTIGNIRDSAGIGRPSSFALPHGFWFRNL